MGYRPPKGVRSPQLEGKRTGRRKGSRNFAQVWKNVRWGFKYRDERPVRFPNDESRLWWMFASEYPVEVERFLWAFNRL
jgi:hypothetical protein